MKNEQFVVFVGLVVFALSASVTHAGGVKGTMYNLPTAKDPIAVNETIRLRVTEFTPQNSVGGRTRGPVIVPRDLKGNPFPVLPVGPSAKFPAGATAVLSSDQSFLFVTGGQFAFTVPSGSNGNQAVTIDFFRLGRDQRGNSFEGRTQTIFGAVVENDVAGKAPTILTYSLIVPRPNARPQFCTPQHFRRCR